MFKLHSQYQPTGDQPLAIDRLTENINKNVKEQPFLVLLERVKHLPLLM